MLKNLIYKKNYWLIAGTIVLLLLCYQLALKPTVQAFNIHNQLKSQLNQASDLTYEPGYLERKTRNIDQLLSRYKTDTLILRGNTIAQVAMIAEKEGVKLSEVPVPDPAYNTPHFIIQKLEFEGTYPALVKTLSHLENSTGIGIPRSATLKTVDRHTANAEDKKTVLQVLLEVKK